MPHWFYSDLSPVSLTFQDSDQATTANATTHTFSAMGIGTASDDRYVVACFMWGSNSGSSFSSATIGGVSADVVGSEAENAGTGVNTIIVMANVPSDATADVVLTVSANSTVWGCKTYSLTGATEASSTANSTANNPTASMSCDGGGAILGNAAAGLGAGAPTASWTGITEDSETNPSATRTHTSAHDNFSTAQSGLTCTCTFSSTLGSCGNFAAFNPS